MESPTRFNLFVRSFKNNQISFVYFLFSRIFFLSSISCPILVWSDLGAFAAVSVVVAVVEMVLNIRMEWGEKYHNEICLEGIK